VKPLVINGKSAWCLACVAAITRIFYGIMTDSPELFHAGWISVILGGIITLPLFISIESISKYIDKKGIAARIASFVFLVNALLDGAITARCISNSATYVAFNHSVRFFLLLPLFLAILWALYCGGEALGSAARLWIWVFPLFMIVIIIFQLPQYRWTWLTPVLGPGIKEILDGTVDSAGWISSVAGLLFLGSGGKDAYKRGSLIKLHATIISVSLVLIVLRYMMAPSLLSSGNRTRIFHLDLILTNGRAPLLLQLPLTIIWFISLFNLLSASSFVASACLQMLFARFKTPVCIISAIAITGALSMSVITERIPSGFYSDWQFAFNALGIIIPMVHTACKGGKMECSCAE